MASAGSKGVMLLLCLALASLLLAEGISGQVSSAVQPGSIREVLREDGFVTTTIDVTNTKASPIQVSAAIKGDISDRASIDPLALVILPATTASFLLTLRAVSVGEFNGTVELSGGIKESVPVRLTVLSRSFLPIDALLMEIQPLKRNVNPGKPLPYKVNLHNLLTDQQYNVTLVYSVLSYAQGSSGQRRQVASESQELFIATSLSLHRAYDVPKDLSTGDYVLYVNATYLNHSAIHFSTFSVVLPFTMVSFLGIRVWQYAAAIATILFLFFGWRWYKRYAESKKRYHAKVDMKTLPKGGPRMAYLGKVAERTDTAFLEMDKLTTHCIVAGATGRGKSVVAQVLVEECLRQDIAVIVFDPTAQWSGMLRKCIDPRMLSLYPPFGMKKTDARAFNGNVRSITHSREVIDITKFAKPGEIHIFTMNRLDPEDIDIFVANTVRTVFKANFQESPVLKILLVYDEVHRLLPRFGGSGEGFVQIERACREFRKWGLGVMLVSQVLSDFVGEIKANINTEIQLRTADEGDLNRIKTKYGEVVLRSLVKAPVGTCMFENPSYNHGNPYFIAVRPLLHGVRRLSDEELEQYNKYNDISDDLEHQLEDLEELGIDVFDLKLELKLAVDKIKTGNFNMVEIYLEGLTPRIQEHWKKLGKAPRKKKVSLVGEEELKADLEAAKKEHDKAKAEEAKAEVQKVEKVLKFERHAAADAAFTFNSGAIITSLGEMRDALESLDDMIFAQHVSAKKNDLAGWVEKSLGMLDIADEFRKRPARQQMLAYLNEVEKKKEMMVLTQGAPLPKEDALAAITRLMAEMEACLKAGKTADAFEIHKNINEYYHLLPREAKMDIYARLTELSKRLRQKK